MLLKALLIGERPGAPALRDRLEAAELLVGEASPPAFWADPSALIFDLLLVDPDALPDPPEPAIESVLRLPQRPEVALFADGLSSDRVLSLQAAGCSLVIQGSADRPEIVEIFTRWARRRRESLRLSLRAARSPAPPRLSEDLVAESPATRDVLATALRAAPAQTSLLIEGETGAGKEWLARAIHAASPRRDGPFIAINCGAIPEGLLESELFGHEKGAFTGAGRTRRGYFEQAHGGTLLLDEIAEMPAALQVRLLRVLQERRVRRLGSEVELPVDVRVLAASHRDLKERLAAGVLRSDLFYRLAVVRLTVPPLRDRREDLPLLAERYLARFRDEMGRHDLEGLSPAALERLLAYDWPGNVRELINVIERAVLLCDGSRIEPGDLPSEIAERADAPAAAVTPPASFEVEAWLDRPVEAGRQRVIEDFERRYFSRLLSRHRGHLGKTAEQAGVDPRTLYNKMRQLGLSKAAFRDPGSGSQSSS